MILKIGYTFEYILKKEIFNSEDHLFKFEKLIEIYYCGFVKEPYAPQGWEPKFYDLAGIQIVPTKVAI